MPFVKTQHGLRYQFSDEPRQAVDWAVAGTVCQGPTCNCTQLTLELTPLEDGAPNPEARRSVILDISDRTLDNQRPPSDPLFAETLVGEMDEKDWRVMRELFLRLKDTLCNTTDLTTLDANFPYDEIEGTGLLVSYNSVFPYHHPLALTVQGHAYSLVDQYCVRPGCDCHDVVIGWCRSPKDELERLASEEFTATVDLVRQRWELNQEYGAPSLPLKTLVKAFAEKIGYDLLLERRKTLRDLYRHNRQRLSPTVRREEGKIGRNDPCPCGSGRKYKKCCGS